MNYVIQLGRYLEAMTRQFAGLTPPERLAFEAWCRRPSSRRDSDWPGWAKYLGPRPQPHKLKLVKSA